MAKKEAQTPENNQQPQPPIMIHSQFIKDLSLEIPHAPGIFSEVKSQPQINIDVNINADHIQDNQFSVDLSFRIDGDVPSKKFFILEMVYSCVVSLNVPQEHVDPVLMIEIPHMLFPYARQAISTILFNGGLPPLMLTPIDFMAMYQNRARNAKAEPSATAKN